VLWAFGAYAVGLASALFLVPYLSSNGHDASVEAAMTGAFFWGPAAALLGFIVALMYSIRSR
jgi:hypothetical protein